MPIKLNARRLRRALTPLFPSIPVSHVSHSAADHGKTLRRRLTRMRHNNTEVLVNARVLTGNRRFPSIALITLLSISNTLFSTSFHSTRHFTRLCARITNHTKHTNGRNRIILRARRPRRPLLRALLCGNCSTFTRRTLTRQHVVRLPP